VPAHHSVKGKPLNLNPGVGYFKLKKYDLAWRHVRRGERMGDPEVSYLIRDLKRVSKEPE